MKILEQGIVEIIPVEELCVSVDQNITLRDGTARIEKDLIVAAKREVIKIIVERKPRGADNDLSLRAGVGPNAINLSPLTLVSKPLASIREPPNPVFSSFTGPRLSPG